MSEIDFSTATATEAAAWIAEQRRRIDAELAASPQPQQTPTPSYDGDDDLSRRRAAAIAAGEAEQAAAAEQARLLDGAKALLRQELPRRGYDAGMVDDLTPAEVMQLARVNDPTPAEARQREQAAILADPRLYAAHEAQQDAKLLEDRWWFLPQAERASECERLGLDYNAINSFKTAQMKNRTAI